MPGVEVFAIRVGWLASGLGENHEVLITSCLYWNHALSGAAFHSYMISRKSVFYMSRSGRRVSVVLP